MISRSDTVSYTALYINKLTGSMCMHVHVQKKTTTELAKGFKPVV